MNESLQALDMSPIPLTGCISGSKNTRNTCFFRNADLIQSIPMNTWHIMVMRKCKIRPTLAGCFFLYDLTINFYQRLCLATKQLAVVRVEHSSDAVRPLVIVKTHVRIKQQEVRRGSQASPFFLGSRRPDAEAVVHVHDILSLEVGEVVVVVV